MGWDTTPHFATDLFPAAVIPVGSSTSEKQKITRFKERFTTVQEFDNTPLPGFTLHSMKHTRNNNDTEWIIIDPRGVLVTISSKNLTSILRVSGITEGLIQEKCVWARENSETSMTLLPMSSSTYAEAVENTEMIADRVAISDVQIGDTVLLQNKLQGKYMGSLSMYSKLSTGSGVLSSTLTAGKALRRQVIEILPNQYYFKADAKILQVIKKTDNPMSKIQAATLINDANKISPAYFSAGERFTANPTIAHYNKIDHISSYAENKVNITLEELTLTEASELILNAYSECDNGKILLENTAGKQFVLDIPWYSSASARTTLGSILVAPVSSIGADRIILTPQNTRYSYYNSPATKHEYPLGYFTKFYRIVKHVKQETYN
jgi:hypothetical protein